MDQTASREHPAQKRLTPEAAVNLSKPVANGIRFAEDAVGRKVFLVINGPVVPPIWLEIAYGIKGRRFDLGHGDEAKTVFSFHLDVKEQLIGSINVLKTGEIPRAKIRGQAEAPIVGVRPAFAERPESILVGAC